MRPHLLPLVLLLLGPAARADSSVFQELRKAAAAVAAPAPVSAEDTERVFRQADKHLTEFLRPYGQNFCCAPLAGDRGWLEVRGLGYRKIEFDPLSADDQANGIAARFRVTLAAAGYRSLGAANAWGDWQEGRPAALPGVLQVERRGGMWITHSDAGTSLEKVNKELVHLPSLIQPAVAETPASRPPPPVPIATTSPRRPAMPPSAGLLAGLIFLPLLAGLAAVLLRSRKSRKSEPAPAATPPPAEPAFAPSDYHVPGLLTPAELKFFHLLAPVVGPASTVCVKVRLADVFEPASGGRAAFNKVSQKHLDFVVMDHASGAVRCAIELDDASHERPGRQQRDQLVNELFLHHGIPLARVPVSAIHQNAGLRQWLAAAGVDVRPAACA
ncbi:DUF2726 domain-containing protein [Haloferula sargassicola]|uniref:DUF2726 domain-containing protein n=1 Tax=Haloferula sargassicola TaxID=490096 RepID=A0ABP9UHM5_9BACT